MTDIEEAIETVQDMLDVMKASGSCYAYKHNGGDARLQNVLDCLRAQQQPNAPLTNADRIRAMSDEELAEFLDNTQKMECESLHIVENGTLKFDSAKIGWLIWLQQTAEEADHG